MPQKTVVCPKCGYEQDERLDCKKCGVVFSKFYALYPQQGAPATVESTEVMDLTEISQQVRDLNRRFNDLEFERAERNRLRGELRVLEQRVETTLKEFTDKLAEAQSQKNAPAPPFSPEDNAGAREFVDQSLAPLQAQLQRLETQLEALADRSRAQMSPSVLDNLQATESRLAEVENRISNLQSQAGPTKAADPRLDFDNIMKELTGMQTSLQNVTVRYSEIGELKKNHLMLSNSVDAILRDLAFLKEEASKGASKKTSELEKEVTALRAEVRQMLKERENLPPLEVDVHSIRENLEDIRRFMASLSQKL